LSDFVCKALSGGMLPMSAVLANDEVMLTIEPGQCVAWRGVAWRGVAWRGVACCRAKGRHVEQAGRLVLS
jgi:adenosylmethionine-8-amino-7-oxononanoate aminotransferase